MDETQISQLADVLIDCVEGGASVSFMHPLARDRADLSEMLVHRRARRRGLGAALVRAAEETARECGRTLLVLDAVTDGDAARLYERLGWQRVGVIPRYALFPDGVLCDTTVYYRALFR